MIYLDYQATTPVDPRVLEKMLPYFKENFGNPSSQGHEFGWKAQAAVQLARKQIAEVIQAKPQEIIFTSGATESNNLALQGVFPDFSGHLIVSAVEHKAVLDVAKVLEKKGVEVTVLPVNRFGQVEIETLEEAIRPETRLVSIIFAHNELGSVNPVGKIGELCRKKGVLFHTDAVQGFGKCKISVDEFKIDFLSASGHKIYGPKGVGILYVRSGVSLAPVILGGGQERGMRSGTLNVPGIVGMGEAAKLMHELCCEETERLTKWRDKIAVTLTQIDGVHLNGHPKERIANNLSLTLRGVESQALQMACRELAFSTGSACDSGNPDGSHVLKAIGLTPEEQRSTIRLSLGRMTQAKEVDRLLELLSQKIPELRV